MRITADGWPFLVARARRSGYRTVLAPDFLANLGEQDLLADHAGGAVRPGDIRRLELPHRDLGPMTLWFTVEPVTSATIGRREAGGNGRPRDEHGRPLEILYGIVARGVVGGEVEAGALRTARERALATFRRLFDGEADFTLESSEPIPLHGVSVLETPALAETSQDQFAHAVHRTRRPMRRSRPRAGVAVAGLALLSAWLLWPEGPGAQVIALEATPAVSCSATDTVRLRATVAVREGDPDKPTTVAYRWLRGDEVIERGTVPVMRGKHQDVSTNTTRGALGEKEVRFALVLNRPEGGNRAITYAPRCARAPTAGNP